MKKYKLTEAQKTKKAAIAFTKELIPDVYGMGAASEEFKKDLASYRLYNNIIDQKDFENFCNPLGLDIPFQRDTVRPYNRTYVYIDTLMGEEIKRSDKPKPIAIGKNAILKAKKELQEAYVEATKSRIGAEIKRQLLISQGADPQQIQEEVSGYMTPEDIDPTEHKSELEILASHIINHASYAHNLYIKKNQGFFHATISAKEQVYVGRNNPTNTPEITVLNPLFLFYDKSPNTKYIQDGSWAAYRSLMTPYEILEMYSDDLTDAERQRVLEGTANENVKGVSKTWDERNMRGLHDLIYRDVHVEDEHGLYGESYYNGNSLYKDRIPVIHIEFKWLRKVGFLTYLNEYGDEETIVVSEEYKTPKDALKVKYRNKFDREVTRYEWGEGEDFKMIEFMWVPDIWELTRINDDIHVRVRRKPGQNINPDAPFNNSLSYKGLKYSATNAEAISVMGRMKPFQYMYIGTLFKIGELIARTTGPVQDIDASMIDPDLGLEKTMVYRNRGLNIYNSITTSKGTQYNMSRPQPGRVNSVSAAQDLAQLINIASWLDTEIGKAGGISPQRAAQFSSDTNVSDNQQAITQSSHMTEMLFTEHNTLWREIVDAYLGEFVDHLREYFKSTSNDTYYLSYVLPDKGMTAVEILPQHVEQLTELGIYTTTSTDGYRYIEDMSNLAMHAMQNNMATLVDISNIMKAKTQGTSVEEVHKMILTAQKKAEDRQAQQAQAEEAMLERQMQAEQNMKIFESNMEARLIQLEENLKKDREISLELVKQQKENTAS